MQTMIDRQMKGTVLTRLLGFPAVALIGPRQAGKTTLARSLAGRYFDLEQQPDRTRLDLNWSTIVKEQQLITLDEAQSWPEVFPRLRGAIDASPDRKGRFLLLGSVSPTLMRQVSESLAGRLALVELTPLTLTEIGTSKLDDLWLFGGYPSGGILETSQFPVWQKNYVDLLAQRDLPNWGLPARPYTTSRFIQMLAALQGQTWNASQLGKSLGLSHPTVNSYLDYLEGAFLVRRLRPYSASVRKRLAKSPRVYWRDSGLLHALLGVTSSSDLLNQPWVGFSWEGFVIEQILAALYQQDRNFNAYFFRTSDAYEIDLVLDINREIWAVEVKLTSNPSQSDVAHFVKTARLINANRQIIVCRMDTPVSSDGTLCCSLPHFLSSLENLLGSV